MPVIQLMLFYFALGAPHGLKLAIFNEDVIDYRHCYDTSSNVYRTEDEVCHVERASCIFVNALDKSFVDKKFFSSFDEAYDQVIHGKAIALLHIKPSFSESCNKYLAEGPNLTSMLTTHEDLEVHIDRTEWGLASDMSHQITNAYESIPRTLLKACNISRNILKPVISSGELLFGEWKWDFRVYITHTLVAA